MESGRVDHPSHNYWWRSAWITGRRNLIYALLKKINIDKDSRLLDVGCGPAKNSEIIKKFGRYWGIEISKRKVKQCLSHVNIFRGDAQRLPLKLKTFDIVFMLDLLEHLDNTDRAIEDAERVLKKGGFLIVMAPAFDFLWSSHDLLVGHKRRYTKSQMISTLNSNGFSIRMISYWNFFMFFPIALMKRSNRIKGTKKEKRNANSGSGIKALHKFTNLLLIFILKLENRLICSNINFPFGISLVAIARKEKD